MNTYFDAKYAIADQVIIAYNGTDRNEILLSDPSVVNKVGKRAFLGSELLDTVVIPEGYVEIGERAFKGCKNLRRASLSSSLRVCAKDAFLYCPSLKNLLAVRKMKQDEYETLSAK